MCPTFCSDDDAAADHHTSNKNVDDVHVVDFRLNLFLTIYNLFYLLLLYVFKKILKN